MPCVLLKTMPDGRVKIRVFGDRDWKNTQHLSRIRYVSANRVHSTAIRRLKDESGHC